MPTGVMMRDRIMFFVIITLILMLGTLIADDYYNGPEQPDPPPIECICSCDDDGAHLTVEPR